MVNISVAAHRDQADKITIGVDDKDPEDNGLAYEKRGKVGAIFNVPELDVKYNNIKFPLGWRDLDDEDHDELLEEENENQTKWIKEVILSNLDVAEPVKEVEAALVRRGKDFNADDHKCIHTETQINPACPYARFREEEKEREALRIAYEEENIAEQLEEKKEDAYKAAKKKIKEIKKQKEEQLENDVHNVEDYSKKLGDQVEDIIEGEGNCKDGKMLFSLN